jgi:glutamate racemase
MHVLITDSGVGGLSVCAYAERFVRLQGASEPIQLTFANAAPANDYGYNSMPTRDEKIETFDRFLRNVTARFAPDLIYVACNTLSVLMPDTPYIATAKIPVRGIVTTGVELLLDQLHADPRSVAIIFGTQTTIDAGTYPRLLGERGIDSSRIISQACPGLADTISEDREGTKTRAEIERWVHAALTQLSARDTPVVACLACTHYGYRKELFAAAFAEAGIAATVVNPNESAVQDIFNPAGAATSEPLTPPTTLRPTIVNHEASVRFVTRYAIPAATIEALSWFLNEISPKTVTAMQVFEHLPDLF